MAIMKRISYRDAGYGKALEYVMFKHDEETKNMVLDQNGNRMLREDYYLTGVNCSAFGFPMEAEQLNAVYGQNQCPEDVKMHQIIISYNPRDGKTYLLDGARAHELSMQYIRECFPNTMGIACTHTDGDHHTGNIHTHYFFSSVWCPEKQENPNADPELGGIPGRKFRADRKAYRKRLEKLDELVRENGLHPDNLTNLPPDAINNSEYWQRIYGQEKLDKMNEQIIAQGGEVVETMYRTDKQKIRDAITVVSSTTRSEAEFREVLLESNIKVEDDPRGYMRYGFLDGKQTYLGITLGANYLDEVVKERILENARDPDRIDNFWIKKDDSPDVQVPDNGKYTESYYMFKRYFDMPLAGDIADFARKKGRKITDNKERMRFWQPLTDAARFIEENRILSLEMLRQDLYSARMWYLNFTVYDVATGYDREERKQIRISRNKLFFAKVIDQSQELLTQYRNSDDPDRFRQEHAAAFREYEDAVSYLHQHDENGEQKSIRDYYKEMMSKKWFAEHSIRRKQHYETLCGKLHQVIAALKPYWEELEEMESRRFEEQTRKMEMEEALWAETWKEPEEEIHSRPIPGSDDLEL